MWARSARQGAAGQVRWTGRPQPVGGASIGGGCAPPTRAARAQDGRTDEFDVGAAADLRPPGSHMLLPLRLLDNFALFTLEEDEDGEPGEEGTAAETLAGLEQLADGVRSPGDAGVPDRSARTPAVRRKAGLAGSTPHSRKLKMYWLGVPGKSLRARPRCSACSGPHRESPRSRSGGSGRPGAASGLGARAGLVGGLPLRARGVLLDHRAAAGGVEEAREAPRCRLAVPAVRDWALDYSEPGALWALTEHAWYRCGRAGPRPWAAGDAPGGARAHRPRLGASLAGQQCHGHSQHCRALEHGGARRACRTPVRLCAALQSRAVGRACPSWQRRPTRWQPRTRCPLACRSAPSV
jgi:hypothetical protein